MKWVISQAKTILGDARAWTVATLLGLFGVGLVVSVWSSLVQELWVIEAWSGTYFILTFAAGIAVGYGLGLWGRQERLDLDDELTKLGMKAYDLSSDTIFIAEHRQSKIPPSFRSDLNVFFIGLERQGIGRVETDDLPSVLEIRLWRDFFPEIGPYLRAHHREEAKTVIEATQKQVDKWRKDLKLDR